VTAVGDYRAELGETPVWCQRTQSLLWVDILAQRVLRYWPETKKLKSTICRASPVPSC